MLDVFEFLAVDDAICSSLSQAGQLSWPSAEQHGKACCPVAIKITQIISDSNDSNGNLVMTWAHPAVQTHSAQFQDQSTPNLDDCWFVLILPESHDKATNQQRSAKLCKIAGAWRFLRTIWPENWGPRCCNLLWSPWQPLPQKTVWNEWCRRHWESGVQAAWNLVVEIYINHLDWMRI